MEYSKFGIYSFKSGINQSHDDSLIKNYEASSAYNCDISRGVLKTKRRPVIEKVVYGQGVDLLSYYNNANGIMFYSNAGTIKKYSDDTILVSGMKSNNYDYINFFYKDKDVMVFTNGVDNIKYYDGTAVYDLKNRRPSYDEEGKLTGYYDANEVFKSTEDAVSTYAPKGKFIELHYDRLWIGGIDTEPDRVYFSTADRNGSDIQDFTFPITEEEANMHGGFIDFSSYDGGKVIGLKVLGDDICVFKERTLFRVFGTDPSSYTKVQIFSSQGAIANKSIVVGGNNCYFLNHSNIYVFDGVNVSPVGDRIHNVLKRLNKNYVQNSAGVYYKEKYYLAVPLDNSTKNNCIIELDTTSGAFMTYDLEANGFLEFNNKLYAVSDNGIYDFHSEGSKVLPLLWESPSIEMDKNAKKIFDYFYAICVGACKITLTTERAEKQIIFNGDKIRKKLKNKGKIYKVRIESIDENTPFELSSPEWFYEVDLD